MSPLSWMLLPSITLMIMLSTMAMIENNKMNKANTPQSTLTVHKKWSW